MGKKLGSFVREKRLEGNNTLRGFGAQCAPPVTAQFITRIESGVSPIPPERIKSFAAVLNVEPWELANLLIEEYTERLKTGAGL